MNLRQFDLSQVPATWGSIPQPLEWIRYLGASQDHFGFSILTCNYSILYIIISGHIRQYVNMQWTEMSTGAGVAWGEAWIPSYWNCLTSLWSTYHQQKPCNIICAMSKKQKKKQLQAQDSCSILLIHRVILRNIFKKPRFLSPLPPILGIDRYQRSMEIPDRWALRLGWSRWMNHLIALIAEQILVKCDRFWQNYETTGSDGFEIPF